jgi:hypothetical protein
MIEITNDPSQGLAYVKVQADVEVAKTDTVQEGFTIVNIDRASDGSIVGVEVIA